MPPALATAIDRVAGQAPAIGASRIGIFNPNRSQKNRARSRGRVVSESVIMISVRRTLQKMILPARRQPRRCGRSPEIVVSPLIVEIQREDLADCHAAGRARDAPNRVAGRDGALPDDAYVETGTAAREKAMDHVVASESDAQLEARLSRLRDEKFRTADLHPIADADIRFEEPFRRQVLAKRSPRELGAGKLTAPVVVVL